MPLFRTCADIFLLAFKEDVSQKDNTVETERSSSWSGEPIGLVYLQERETR